MSATPTEPAHNPTFRTVNLDAEIKKIWGVEWGKAPTSYEFSNGRKFELQTGDAGIYKPQT